ncbi:hypothetical protein P171DRAFT_447365 [Karstenula rhodostoma CBS 690.94]|uniref:Uncharacterized protein n=1 Tax=Karstenula rhodostoma CBS 690.94 TaxID=1392251 RepID=A0A9P4PCB6_9PLEO|nr:hypothetical protein P171DRAFT_447365 [Karstenula rhodostoma CBS 690.94]
MLKTRAPIIRRSSAVASSTASSCKSSSATSLNSARTLPLAPKLCQDRPLKAKLIKDNAPIVSVPGTASNEEKTKNKDRKRKAATLEVVSEEHIPAVNTAKTSSKSIDPITELLFPSVPASEVKDSATSPKKVASDGATPDSPSKRVARQKKPAVDPFRNDIRMGTSGKMAAGSGTRSIHKPTPAKAAKPAPTNLPPKTASLTPEVKVALTNPLRRKSTPAPDGNAASTALKKLKAYSIAAAYSKQSSTILTDLNPHKIPGMVNKLVAADKSIAKPRGAAAKAATVWKPKPRDEAYGGRTIPASKTAGLSKGSKKLLKSMGENTLATKPPAVNKNNLGKILDKGENQPGMRSMISAASHHPAMAAKRKRENEEVGIEGATKSAKRMVQHTGMTFQMNGIAFDDSDSAGDEAFMSDVPSFLSSLGENDSTAVPTSFVKETKKPLPKKRTPKEMTLTGT